MIIFILGVSGSGKTTVGQRLAAQIGLPFFDGDAFHSKANIAKMAAGIPLEDSDRVDWLDAINERAKQVDGAVFACSGLKESYRLRLRTGLNKPVKWVLLEGEPDLIKERMLAREGHFMPVDLLRSQLALLEIPKYAVRVNVAWPLEYILEYITKNLDMKQEFGLIGLGVMGTNLSRNLARKGFRLSLYNRFVAGKEEGVASAVLEVYPEFGSALGFEDLEAFVDSLSLPRRIFLMVNAGAATDAVATALFPLLSQGDIVMDGGNAHFQDTARRQQTAADLGLHWLGVGVSGGAEGALNGPSVMVGGTAAAFQPVQQALEALAARDQMDGPCCSHVGPSGAGHFVKMVHNGIEYAEMQLLAECYFLLRRSCKMDPDAISAVFEQWQAMGDGSYLLEITQSILRKKADNGWLLDQILDAAANKGTGSWATVAAAELGVPATLISTALFARYLSAFVEERQRAAAKSTPPTGGESVQPEQVQKAYRTARIINHHQGFQLLVAASEQHQWQLQPMEIARIWTNGCIIRSKMMERLAQQFPEQGDILDSGYWFYAALEGQPSMVACLNLAQQQGMALPCFSAALSYFHGLMDADSPMNLVQAQRDYFGAHTYLLKADPGAGPVHTDWLSD